MILSAQTFTYTVSKFFFSWATDHYPVRYMFAGGMFMTGFVMLAFSGTFWYHSCLTTSYSFLSLMFVRCCLVIFFQDTSCKTTLALDSFGEPVPILTHRIHTESLSQAKSKNCLVENHVMNIHHKPNINMKFIKYM